jgi:ferredoxin-NADP reductase
VLVHSTPPNLEVRLASIEYGARNINLYRFRSLDGRPLPSAEPGAHIDLHIDDNFVRSYSLISGPKYPGEYVIGVLANIRGRGGSKLWHAESRVGKVYKISFPRNTFVLSSHQSQASLFAGGIGITPLISMYRHLKGLGQSPRLFYWARSPEDMLFVDELAADPSAEQYLTDVPGTDWPKLTDVIANVSHTTDLYCCGPASMLDEFAAATADRQSHLVHMERFAGAPIGKRKTRFTVTLARAQRTLTVLPGETILAACLKAGIDIAYSCEEGVCGACEVKVLIGKVDHKDSVRTSDEHDRAGTMMICCSMPVAGDVTLDI